MRPHFPENSALAAAERRELTQAARQYGLSPEAGEIAWADLTGPDGAPVRRLAVDGAALLRAARRQYPALAVAGRAVYDGDRLEPDGERRAVRHTPAAQPGPLLGAWARAEGGPAGPKLVYTLLDDYARPDCPRWRRAPQAAILRAAGGRALRAALNARNLITFEELGLPAEPDAPDAARLADALRALADARSAFRADQAALNAPLDLRRASVFRKAYEARRAELAAAERHAQATMRQRAVLYQLALSPHLRPDERVNLRNRLAAPSFAEAGDLIGRYGRLVNARRRTAAA